MEAYDYHVAVKPFDLILGLAGCHSSFTKLFTDAAEEYGVPLYKLIVEVSKIDQKAPSVDLIREIAAKIKG